MAEQERCWVLAVPIRPRALPAARAKAGQKGYRPRSYQKWAAEVIGELRRIWKNRKPLDGPLKIQAALGRGAFTIWIDPLEQTARDGLRGDVDNYCKAILDCVTQAGIITDDRQVEILEAHFYAVEEET
jgi:Holliday junction resolvase RusA-like endonuclease